MYNNVVENVIEFLRNDKQATVTFSQPRYINTIKKYAEECPDQCQIITENDDGSIIAHIPTQWIKIQKPREMSEEQKQILRDRLNAIRQDKEKQKEITDV